MKPFLIILFFIFTSCSPITSKENSDSTDTVTLSQHECDAFKPEELLDPAFYRSVSGHACTTRKNCLDRLSFFLFKNSDFDMNRWKELLSKSDETELRQYLSQNVLRGYISHAKSADALIITKVYCAIDQHIKELQAADPDFKQTLKPCADISEPYYNSKELYNCREELYKIFKVLKSMP
jgi:hypothetical protein